MEVSELLCPAALSPEKDPPVHIGQEGGWAPEPVWTQQKNKPMPVAGIEHRSSSPQPGHNADGGFSAPLRQECRLKTEKPY
jgi:hypothetical protein